MLSFSVLFFIYSNCILLVSDGSQVLSLYLNIFFKMQKKKKKKDQGESFLHFLTQENASIRLFP